MAWDASFARLMVQETLRHWTSGAYINYVFCILTNFSVRNYDSLLILSVTITGLITGFYNLPSSKEIRLPQKPDDTESILPN